MVSRLYPPPQPLCIIISTIVCVRAEIDDVPRGTVRSVYKSRPLNVQHVAVHTRDVQTPH